MITIFIYGCNCGSIGRMTRKVKAYAQANGLDYEIRNSKYSEDARIEHAAYLAAAGAPIYSYPAIAVLGEDVILLKEWNLS